MGGLPLPEPAQTILTALAAHASGDLLPFHRLRHTLSHLSDADVPTLEGLTHLSSHVHQTSSLQTGPLRALLTTALLQDRSTLTSLSSCSRTSYISFCTNLISADASFVEPLLKNLVHNFLPHPLPDDILPLLVTLLSTTLRVHPRASPLLSDLVRRRFPHPVRPPAELSAFSAALFHIVRNMPDTLLESTAISTLLDRLAVLDAHPSAPEAHLSKVEALSLVLLNHIDLLPSVPNLHKYISSYEACVVPVHHTPVSPYILLYIASHNGAQAVHALADRLRQTFHDNTAPPRLRAHFLHHSAILIARSALLTVPSVQLWLVRLSHWLNVYIDALLPSSVSNHYRGDNRNIVVDIDLHHLFYTACALLIAVLIRRTDVLASNAQEFVARLRLSRILNAPIQPLVVLPKELADSLGRVLTSFGSADVEHMLKSPPKRFAPSRTRLGSRNQFVFEFRAPDLQLPVLRKHVDRFVRWDKPLDDSSEDKNDREGNEERSKLQLTAEDGVVSSAVLTPTSSSKHLVDAMDVSPSSVAQECE